MKRNKNLIYGILAVFVLVVAVIGYKAPSIFREQNLDFIVSENDSEKKQPPEFINDIVVIRELDKELIRQKIEDGKEYLFRMIDEEENGAHKYYYALNDTFENRLHTIYTSTLTYTLLKLYNLEKDDLLLDQALKCGEYILSMQNKKEGSKGYGAFYYSYFLDSKEKEKKFVVGTTSKTIFTLLKLYELTDDTKYLESAKLGADWLVTMQKPDGSMKPYMRYDAEDKKWLYGAKESLLYNGQVLSALSKIYIVTKDEKYYNTAEKIAQRFAQKYEEAERNYIVGEYRSKNPISNSWVVMSFIDFYRASPHTKQGQSAEGAKIGETSPHYGVRASGDSYYKDVIFELSDLILKNQKTDPDDILRYGQWNGAYSTSGVGWIAEVMAEVHELCRTENRADCDKYKEGIVLAIRWLIQNTYSKENSSFLKNPERAIGGIFWNEENKYVRTDSVAHGLNGYIGIINYLKDGVLISAPENY